jgi:glycosyltransferase involved in cell wall biosynthesis
VPLYPDHSRSAARRTANYVSFALTAVLLGPLLVSRPDVIFVYSPPLTIGFPAAILSTLWRVPFVFNVQDLWPDTLRATGMVNSERVLRLVGLAARLIYRAAADVVVISRGFQDRLLAQGVSSGKLHVVHDWVDVEHYRPLPPDRQEAQRLGLDGRFNVMFAGTMGMAQGLDSVLDAADDLRDLPDLQFVFVGDGVEAPVLQERAAAMRLPNVRFLGRFPPDDMPRLLSLADVLLMHVKDDPLFRITVPHKVFTYLATGKPVLAAIAGDAADVVLEAGAGISCPPADPRALASAVRRLYVMGEADRRTMGEAGRQAACEQYSATHLVAQLAGIMERATMRRKS